MPLLRIARDHAIAKAGIAIAKNVFLDRFKTLFIRAGYKPIEERKMDETEFTSLKNSVALAKAFGGDYEKAGITGTFTTFEYKAPPDERNNLDRFYKIMGRDPASGRLQPIYFPIG